MTPAQDLVVGGTGVHGMLHKITCDATVEDTRRYSQALTRVGPV